MLCEHYSGHVGHAGLPMFGEYKPTGSMIVRRPDAYIVEGVRNAYLFETCQVPEILEDLQV